MAGTTLANWQQYSRWLYDIARAWKQNPPPARTPGTGAGYLINHSGGYTTGALTVAVDTGAGTVLVGDILTFAGVSGQYVVASSVGGGSVTSITFTPGLAGAVADNAAVTEIVDERTALKTCIKGFWNTNLQSGTRSWLQEDFERKSARPAAHVNGTGSGYLVNHSGGYAANAVTAAIDTGSGTLLAGDVIKFAGVAGSYSVVSSVGGGTATSVTFTPGLAGSVADNAAITIGFSETVGDPDYEPLYINAKLLEFIARDIKKIPLTDAEKTLVDALFASSGTLKYGHNTNDKMFGTTI